MLINNQCPINAAELGDHIKILTEPTLIASNQFASLTRVLFFENNPNQSRPHWRVRNLSPCLKLFICFI